MRLDGLKKRRPITGAVILTLQLLVLCVKNLNYSVSTLDGLAVAALSRVTEHE